MAVERQVTLVKSWAAWAAKVVAVDEIVSEIAEWEEVMVLRSLRVLAWWVAMASMKIFIGERSGRMLDKRGVSLAAMASGIAEVLVSKMFSLMRKAAAQMALHASAGTLDNVAAVRRIWMALEWL